MNSHSDKGIVISINNVSIFIGDVFDFVRVSYIEGFGLIDSKLFLFYKRQNDNLLVSFSLRQASYFTVKGGEIPLANSNNLAFQKELEKINGNWEQYFSEITANKINFVDSFIVLKGNEDNEKHHPNLEINQPITGFGLEWMQSSIEKKELELILKRRMEENRKEDIALKEKKDIEKQKMIHLLTEEKERASNESSLETFNRQFAYLNKALFESITN